MSRSKRPIPHMSMNVIPRIPWTIELRTSKLVYKPESPSTYPTSAWLLWPPYVIGQAIIFLPCGFYLLFSIFFISSPNLSGRKLDVCHTSTHGVAQCEFRMQVWNVLHVARWKYRTQKWRKKSPSGHHPTTLSGYIFATKACIDNRKKLVSSNISSTCPDNMVNFDPLAAEIVSGVWGTPATFNSCTACSSGRQPNFAALNRGRHLCSAGRPSRWALAHISSYP